MLNFSRQCSIIYALRYSDALQIKPPIDLKSFKRYVDHRHARFRNCDEADRFKDILNEQHHNIHHTIKREDKEQVLNFLDIKVKNNKSGQYEFSIHGKEAITNVQIKKISSHDLKIQCGIIKCFTHRVFPICRKTNIGQELKFLTKVLNEYEYPEVTKIIAEIKAKLQTDIHTRIRTSNANELPLTTMNNQQTIILPWIPGLSPK